MIVRRKFFFGFVRTVRMFIGNLFDSFETGGTKDLSVHDRDLGRPEAAQVATADNFFSYEWLSLSKPDLMVDSSGFRETPPPGGGRQPEPEGAGGTFPQPGSPPSFCPCSGEEVLPGLF